MARVQQVIDDLTGATLNEDVEPTTITVDGTDYTLDLGSASKERLVRWLKGEDSLTQAAAPRRRSTTTTAKPASDDTKAARAWAIASGFKYTNAKGEEVTLGDRGRVPEAVMDGWKAAGSPA